MSTVSLTRSVKVWRGLAAVRAILQRLAANALILLIIAYLTLYGLAMAERGQRRLPAQPLDTAAQTLAQTVEYITHHPGTYHWNKQDIPASDLVLTSLGRSVVLLVLALGVAVLIGVPMGILIALFRRAPTAPLMVLVSVLGISTPSFLLGMFFWTVNIYTYRWFGWDQAPLPQVGFGWDAHLVMPVLVLATRPLAQIMQVAYISMSEVLRQDYIQVARAKGLARHVVIGSHALRNILIPVLTTMSTSLRFSLASLPVVEMFFNWPGAGLVLLRAIEQGEKWLTTDLIVSLGLLFLLVNLALEALYQYIDPRLRENNRQEERSDRATWREQWDELKESLSRLILGLRLHKRATEVRQPHAANSAAPGDTSSTLQAPPLTKPRRSMLRNILGNPALIVGSLLILGMFGLAFFGERLARTNPYTLHGVMMIESVIHAPPFNPLPTFPWGTDLVGRDVQGLVLAGAKRTLTLALAGMTARVLLGTVLGILAGWWKNGWLDKLIRGAVAVWAAFPVTLFAMIVIRAIGIQKGMWVFVVTICIVGWGEAAQFIRGQVISLKPQPFVEAARAVGARPSRILRWHVLPHLFAPLLVLAILEMGGVLMLLAELGFLNIFLGGGFKLEITPSYIYFFSDVPEWGALLANIHRWWRAYPWMAWYPGGAFFIAILAFNLWGEGMRRWLDETRLNVARLVNRYTFLAIGVLAAGLGWSLHTSTPMSLYQSQAAQFDAQAAIKDITALASSEFQGRESGTSGSTLAAEYIARRMRQVGLQPAGSNNTYFQSTPAAFFHLTQMPRLEILGEAQVEPLVYRQDFVEYTGFPLSYGWGKGQVVGLAFGAPNTGSGQDAFLLDESKLQDKILLVREADARYVEYQQVSGVLVVGNNPQTFLDKRLIQQANRRGYAPAFYITPQLADRLLATAGGMAQLDALAGNLPTGQTAPIEAGVWVRMSVEGTIGPETDCRNVIGYIPGTGANMNARPGRGLDSEVILVGAYYDGLGVGPDGALYPGANHNASGTAAMLEIARVLAQGPYTPIRTVVFVAWCGGERGKSLDASRVMSARRGFNTLSLQAVVELSGVGGGSGQGLLIGAGSDAHLAQIFKNAADRLNANVVPTPPGAQPLRKRLALIDLRWDGARQTAHTAQDTPGLIEPDKLRQVGQVTTLALTIISRELEY